jgi:succinate dehydrogenase/fumarate reductase flavoprotein subunit
VVGVQAIANDTLSYFQAKRAVVLTTGDYSRNDDMTRTYSPFTYYAVKATALGSTGDGIRMAQQVGADLCCMGGTMATSVVAVSGTVSSNTSIYVNNRGQRFTNEDNMSIAASQLAPAYVPAGWTSYYPGFAIFNQDQMQAWAIFDTAGKGSNTLTAPTVSASTIPALATALGVNPTALTNTVNLWNADAASNVDTLYGRPEHFFQLSTPPYYATPLTWETILAHGGMKINASTQVLDTFGYPIPRLYAAGSTTGGIMGRFYQHSGGGIGSANTLGRIAGTKAAAETPWS